MATKTTLVVNIRHSHMSEFSTTPSAPETPEQNTLPSEAVQHANKKMQEYEKYIEELHRRHPETFDKLNRFIKRGVCECPHRGTCPCSERGMICTCDNSKECRCGKDNSECSFRQIKHKVRVYDIHPKEKEWKKFLKVDPITPERAYYNAAEQSDFLKLQEKLESPIEAKEEKKGATQDKQASDEVYLTLPCRVITVNHLSPNVAKLLGGLYDIPADFFNRHLPGTEAISGRLISRLPSSVQIDFGELYESTDTFDELWPHHDILDGHQIIREAVEQSFLFQDVGWDYQPVGKKDWEQSFDNNKLSSGDECKEGGRQKNVFQFNLTHRISVYSKPPGHPDIGQ